MATGRVPTTANSPLTAKGDLFTYSTAPARLAVGNNGEQIVADSAASTGLRWQGDYAAGKNKVINGDFYWNQRNFTTGTGSEYVADRTFSGLSGATGTTSRELFTVGQTAVPGNPLAYAKMVITTGNDFARLIQRIENVSTFAGQTATLSFYAKGVNPTTAGKLNVRLQQNFGTTGSPSASVATAEQDLTLTASWVRYSYTFAVPSISGKTITANDNLTIDIGQLANASTDGWTLEIAQLQLEAGSVATAFQTATGTLQGELAACQRYYWRTAFAQEYANHAIGFCATTTSAMFVVNMPVAMRVKPTVFDYSTLRVYDGNADFTPSSVTQTGYYGSSTSVGISAAITGATQYRPALLLNSNSTAGYIGFGAEL